MVRYTEVENKCVPGWVLPLAPPRGQRTAQKKGFPALWAGSGRTAVCSETYLSTEASLPITDGVPASLDRMVFLTRG
jgi:hypothetical protein